MPRRPRPGRSPRRTARRSRRARGRTSAARAAAAGRAAARVARTCSAAIAKRRRPRRSPGWRARPVRPATRGGARSRPSPSRAEHAADRRERDVRAVAQRGRWGRRPRAAGRHAGSRAAARRVGEEAERIGGDQRHVAAGASSWITSAPRRPPRASPAWLSTRSEASAPIRSAGWSARRRARRLTPTHALLRRAHQRRDGGQADDAVDEQEAAHRERAHDAERDHHLARPQPVGEVAQRRRGRDPASPATVSATPAWASAGSARGSGTAPSWRTRRRCRGGLTSVPSGERAEDGGERERRASVQVWLNSECTIHVTS